MRSTPLYWAKNLKKQGHKYGGDSSKYTDEDYKARLRSKCITDPFTGCWLYQGAIGGPEAPYGMMSYRGKQWRVHRLAYFLWKGPLDPALDVCHSCDVKRCCNPDHVWQGTPKENMQDAAKKRIWSRQHQTKCRHGHEFTPENVYYAPSSPTKRQCRACQRERQKGRWSMLTDEQRERIYAKRRERKQAPPGSQL